MTLWKECFENIVEKGETDGYQYSVLFPYVFSSLLEAKKEYCAEYS